MYNSTVWYVNIWYMIIKGSWEVKTSVLRTNRMKGGVRVDKTVMKGGVRDCTSDDRRLQWREVWETAHQMTRDCNEGRCERQHVRWQETPMKGGVRDCRSDDDLCVMKGGVRDCKQMTICVSWREVWETASRWRFVCRSYGWFRILSCRSPWNVVLQCA